MNYQHWLVYSLVTWYLRLIISLLSTQTICCMYGFFSFFNSSIQIVLKNLVELSIGLHINNFFCCKLRSSIWVKVESFVCILWLHNNEKNSKMKSSRSIFPNVMIKAPTKKPHPTPFCYPTLRIPSGSAPVIWKYHMLWH